MRATGVKLELVITEELSALLNGLVGGVFGHNRADVARFLLQSQVRDRYETYLSERSRLAVEKAMVRRVE